LAVFQAFTDDSAAQKGDVLQALARRDPRLLARHDWAQAVKVGTEKSGQILLALVCDGELGNAEGVDSFHLSRQLAHLGEEFPGLNEEMLQRYQRLGRGRPKSILESALIELADASIICALIRGYAADHRSYDGGLANALRNAALGRRPVEGWSANAYEEFSVSLAELHRELFGLALANGAQSRLAEACLVEIEELRDEHGARRRRTAPPPTSLRGNPGRSSGSTYDTRHRTGFGPETTRTRHNERERNQTNPQQNQRN
jgi:hypothetical protein